MAVRAAASAHLTFGLVSIPVKFYVAASAEGVHFHLLTPAGNRVKQRYVDEFTGEEIKQGDCAKGFEYAKGQSVVFTQEEIKALDAAKTDCVEIQEFISATEIDPVYVEKAYYLGPDKGGDKGYVLLSRTMAKMGVMAMAKWVSRGRDHLVVIAPKDGGLQLYQLYYNTEVRDFKLVIPSGPVVISDGEMAMAERLVNMLLGDGDPAKYTNGYLERARAAVDAKVAGKQVVQIPNEPNTSTVDLFEALKRSLEENKKSDKSPDPK